MCVGQYFRGMVELEQEGVQLEIEQVPPESAIMLALTARM